MTHLQNTTASNSSGSEMINIPLYDYEIPDDSSSDDSLDLSDRPLYALVLGKYNSGSTLAVFWLLILYLSSIVLFTYVTYVIGINLNELQNTNLQTHKRAFNITSVALFIATLYCIVIIQVFCLAVLRLYSFMRQTYRRGCCNKLCY